MARAEYNINRVLDMMPQNSETATIRRDLHECLRNFPQFERNRRKIISKLREAANKLNVNQQAGDVLTAASSAVALGAAGASFACPPVGIALFIVSGFLGIARLASVTTVHHHTIQGVDDMLKADENQSRRLRHVLGLFGKAAYKIRSTGKHVHSLVTWTGAAASGSGLMGFISRVTKPVSAGLDIYYLISSCASFARGSLSPVAQKYNEYADGLEEELGQYTWIYNQWRG